MDRYTALPELSARRIARKGLALRKNVQQNKGGPTSCRPCIAGEERSIAQPLLWMVWKRLPSFLCDRRNTLCETTKKCAYFSALFTKYSTLSIICTPPTVRRILPGLDRRRAGRPISAAREALIWPFLPLSKILLLCRQPQKTLPAPKVSKEPLVCFALLWYNEQSK